MEDLRFALLIDSDNVSADYVQKILDELNDYGTVPIRRIYGDWSKRNSNKWTKVLNTNAIQAMQQFAYTKGKNATDSFMIIDAMDILFLKENINGFCLVTSDSDFTRLAARLRESGKYVIGMGENKTPEAFINNCDKFIYLDLITKEDHSNNSKKLSREITKDDIEQTILDILEEKEDAGKSETDIGELGSRLQKIYPDFDVRTYGKKNFSSFCESLSKIKLNRNSKSIMVSKVLTTNDDMDQLLKSILNANDGKIELGLLNQEIRKNIPNFSSANYGFKHFKKFVASYKFLKVYVDKESSTNFVKLI